MMPQPMPSSVGSSVPNTVECPTVKYSMHTRTVTWSTTRRPLKLLSRSMPSSTLAEVACAVTGMARWAARRDASISAS